MRIPVLSAVAVWIADRYGDVVSQQPTTAVIGAGVIGAAVALALSREGQSVLLLDRAEPGIAGASFGNAGHIAAELVQPLPSPALLFGFWRELMGCGGVLDLPASQALRMLPWISRFAASAFRRSENTRHLRPLVLPAAAYWARWLDAIARPDLLRRHGHYEIDFGIDAQAAAQKQAGVMQQLGIATQTMSAEQLRPVIAAAGAPSAAGLWFENTAHVVDPLEAVRAFVAAARQRDTTIRRLDVRALRPRSGKIEILSQDAAFAVDRAVVCAGTGSPLLLASFGLRAPLQSVRGYHLELHGSAPLLDAPVVYSREHLVVTPMTGRLRASSYMEFAAPDAPLDARKMARLRQRVRAVGYDCALEGGGWVGARPVLPDYLPGIGRASGPEKLFYAIGHQHIGLTTAPITADLIADLVADRPPRLPIGAFDLRRFA